MEHSKRKENYDKKQKESKPMMSTGDMKKMMKEMMKSPEHKKMMKEMMSEMDDD